LLFQVQSLCFSGDSALSTGDFTILLIDDANKVYVFKRSSGNQNIVVALNNSRQAKDIPIPIPHLAGQWKAPHGNVTMRERKSAVDIALSPKSGAIIELVHN